MVFCNILPIDVLCFDVQFSPPAQINHATHNNLLKVQSKLVYHMLNLKFFESRWQTHERRWLICWQIELQNNDKSSTSWCWYINQLKLNIKYWILLVFFFFEHLPLKQHLNSKAALIISPIDFALLKFSWYNDNSICRLSFARFAQVGFIISSDLLILFFGRKVFRQALIAPHLLLFDRTVLKLPRTHLTT
jgi:hypothetical protein